MSHWFFDLLKMTRAGIPPPPAKLTKAGARRLLEAFRLALEGPEVDDRLARQACAFAIEICRMAGLPPPIWLSDLVRLWLLLETTAAGRQRAVIKADEVTRLWALVRAMGDADRPSERHFRAAAEYLSQDGHPVSAAALKKTYQRLA